jgi:tetratricopeptide (TPR) repeat protein
MDESRVLKHLAEVEEELRDKPGDPFWNSDMGAGSSNLGQFRAKQGRFTEACQLYERAIRHQRLALESRPNHSLYRKWLRNHYLGLALALLGLGDHDKAAQAATEVAGFGKDDSENSLMAYRLLNFCSYLAREDSRIPPGGRGGLAARYQEQGRGLLLRAAAGQIRKDASLYLDYARGVLTPFQLPAYPGSRMARELAPDTFLALELAQEAVRREPENPDAWTLLGRVWQAKGDSAQAVEALNRSLQLSQAGTGEEFFMLALAHQNLKDGKEARTCYDRAVTWMEKNRPGDKELQKWRDQAEEALGLVPRELLPLPREVP